MKNILNEELNQMKYLFGYKRGVVISEQENQDELKIKYELSKLGGDSGQEIQKYYKDAIQGNDSVQPEKRYLDLIDAQYSKLTPEQKNKFLANYNKTRTTGPLTGELASTGQEVIGMSPTPSWDSINPVPQKPETAPNKTPQDSEQTTDKSKFNFPELRAEVEKYEDTVMTTAPQKIKDALNQNRDNRSVGVSDSMDKETAIKKAKIYARTNLAKKLQNNTFSTPIDISDVKDGKTYVVLGIA